MSTHVDALRKAIQHAGSQGKLASSISAYLNRPTFKQQTISYWLRTGTLIGPEYWPAIEHATAGLVTRADLRPDVFPAAA